MVLILRLFNFVTNKYVELSRIIGLILFKYCITIINDKFICLPVALMIFEAAPRSKFILLIQSSAIISVLIFGFSWQSLYIKVKSASLGSSILYLSGIKS